MKKEALVNTYFLGKARVPDATARRIRDYVALWGDHRELTGYARGAWNYKLMMDASGFLAAEEWGVQHRQCVAGEVWGTDRHRPGQHGFDGG